MPAAAKLSVDIEAGLRAEVDRLVGERKQTLRVVCETIIGHYLECQAKKT